MAGIFLHSELRHLAAVFLYLKPHELHNCPSLMDHDGLQHGDWSEPHEMHTRDTVWLVRGGDFINSDLDLSLTDGGVMGMNRVRCRLPFFSFLGELGLNWCSPKLLSGVIYARWEMLGNLDDEGDVKNDELWYASWGFGV